MLRPFPLRQQRRPSKKVFCRQLCLVLSLPMHTLILLLRILKKHNPPSVRGPGTKKGYALAVSPQKGCRAKERKATWFPYTNLSKCTLSPSFFVALSHTQLLIHSAITGSSLLFLTPGQTGSSRAILRSGGRQAYNCQTSPRFSGHSLSNHSACLQPTSATVMASKPLCGQITNNTNSSGPDAQGLMPKRPPADDDDVEFVSANPVKKARHVGPQSSQTPATQTPATQPPATQQQMSMPPPPLAVTYKQFVLKPQARFTPLPPPPPLPPQQVMAPPLAKTNPVIPQLDRCQSLQPNAPTSDMSLDGRVSSVPNFENFAFPPPQLSPAMFRPARMSEALSPKQLPQSISPKPPQASTPGPRPPDAPMQPMARHGQISCLEFQGAPLNFELGKLFPGDMAGSNEFATNTTTGPPSNSMPAPPGFGSMGSQNAIPFAMYSTGNFVPMPQPQHSVSPQMFQPNPGPARGMGTPSLSNNHLAWDKTKHPPVYGQARTPGGGFQGGHYPGTAPQKSPPCAVCARGRQEITFRPTLHGPIPPSVANHHCPTTPGNSHMLNQPTSFLDFSTTPGNPAMPNQPAPLQNHPHHQIPPTYRPNTPAPSQQNMHRPQAPPPSTTPTTTTTTKPTNPTPAPKKPHTTQSLLVDVAETVELCFPYQEVAARHGVTPVKVKEALSGVVLLPLLRVAGDKRRAGKLAQERMREYKEVRGVVQQQGQGQGGVRGEGGMGGLKEMAWLLEGGGGNGGGGGYGCGNGSGSGR